MRSDPLILYYIYPSCRNCNLRERERKRERQRERERERETQTHTTLLYITIFRFQSLGTGERCLVGKRLVRVRGPELKS